MFSRSFKRSQQQIDNEIAIRARPTEETVRRSPACSGESNYDYSTATGFRVFRHGTDNYVQNLLADFSNVYQKGITTLPYHHALTALHHASASRAVDNFLCQVRIASQLITMHNSPPPPPPPAPVPVPEPEPTCFAKARRQLAKMKFDLPPPHPKGLVVYRTPDGRDLSEINTSFDPVSFASSAKNTFVKTCCKEYSSVQECRCFNRRSKTSVTYVNERGESIGVYYLSRKTDYHNLAQSYPMSYQPDDEHIPRSPREDVSDSDMYPWRKDYDFESECGDAYCAKQQGFTHVWSSKKAKQRHLRRQRRQQQLASGELPEHGLIIVTFDIDEVWPVKVPLSLHAQHRQLLREKFEELQQHIRFYESWAEEHQRRPKPPAPVPAAAPSPALPKQFSTEGLDHSQMRRLIWHERKENAVLHIQRPLSSASLCIAHGVSRMQVTDFSVLKQHQRTCLTAMASLSALVAIRMSAERGHTSSIATMLHHRAIQLILRRATGSHAAADQIAAPYVKYSPKIPTRRSEELRIEELMEEMRARFEVHCPVPRAASRQFAGMNPTLRNAPIEFKRAKYYAAKCLELVGNEDDPVAAARWAELGVKVQRVRKGEMSIHDVFASRDHNNWVYAIHYTYVRAVRGFLSSADRWCNEQYSVSHHAASSASRRSPFWEYSNEIRTNAPKYVQTVLIVREMYRFIVKTYRLLTPEFMNAFCIPQAYVNQMILRTKHLAYDDGDEASALMFGFLLPSLMTPDVHPDILVPGRVFQHPDLYVKMSDPVLGSIKKQLKDMIPSRHTGTIDRKTLMDDLRIVRRG